jgi:hydrogenase maturation protein HypF
MWLEQLASSVAQNDAYPFPYVQHELDFRPLLLALVRDRSRGRPLPEIARAFQRGVAEGLRDAVLSVCKDHGLNIAVLSGGVFQNELLLRDVRVLFEAQHIEVWTNHAVPPNDGGISLGQAAIAAFSQMRSAG